MTACRYCERPAPLARRVAMIVARTLRRAARWIEDRNRHVCGVCGGTHRAAP